VRFVRFIQKLLDLRRQTQINRLVIKSARRCCRDLAHAVDRIPPEDSLRSLFEERVKVWKNVFWNSSQYRDDLYDRLEFLEGRVQVLTERLQKAGLETCGEDQPF